MKLMRTPRTLNLEITSRCNNRCRYCSHFESPGDVKNDLPLEEWLVFFEELAECSVMSVSLQGGEPFYREDIRQVIKGIVENRMRYDILSNGSLVDEEMASFLYSTGRCNGVQVSIDGSSAEIHDSFRGPGTFVKSIEGIEVLRKHNLPVSIRVTIHRQNVHDLKGIAHLLLEEMSLPFFSVNSISYLGLGRKNPGQFQLTLEERILAMEVLLRLKRKYKCRISATSGPLAEAENWIKMEKARREKKAPYPNRGYLSGCGCINKSMAVRADGIMVPCNLLSHINLGRINRDNLRDIWQNHPELKRLRERSAVSLDSFKLCKGCEYINYCTGNCPAIAYSKVGDDHHPAPDACLKLFLEAGGGLPDEGLLT